MDIKITGVTFDILRDALAQAREARLDILGQMARGHRAPARGAVAVRAAHHHGADRPVEDRPADRQGRRDDPRPVGGVRVPDRRQRRGPGARLLGQRRARRGAGRAHPLDDQGGRGRRRVPAARSSRRRRSARSSSWPRAPTACCTSPTSRPVSASTRSRRCSTRATRSRSAWSRSTASAAASACASPRTRRSPASPSRSSAVGVGGGGGGNGGGRAGAQRPRRPRPARDREGGGGDRGESARLRSPAASQRSRSRAGLGTCTGAPADRAGLGRTGRHGVDGLRAIRGAGLLDRDWLGRRGRRPRRACRI